LKPGEYLRQCREQNEMKQGELVTALYQWDPDLFDGLDAGTISKWERGISKPKISRLIEIIKYFQKQTGTALPCWDRLSVEDAEKQICEVGIRNRLTGIKDIILDFPSQLMTVDNLKVYPLRNSDRMDALIEMYENIAMDIHHPFTRQNKHRIKEWAMHPGSIFPVCEYKNTIIGYSFAIKLKPESFEKVLNLEIGVNDIDVDDFAGKDELGSIFLISFYALSDKAAALLLVRQYAYLIAHQKSIEEVGRLSFVNEKGKGGRIANLDQSVCREFEDGTTHCSFRQSLPKIFATETVLRMIFPKQECSEA